MSTENEYFIKMVEGIFDQLDSMPEADRDAMFKRCCEDIISNTGDPKNISKFIDAYSQHKDVKNLNLQVINILGSMKAALNEFDENDNSTAKARDNLAFFCNFMKLFSLPMVNLTDNLDKFKKKYE